MRLFYCPPEEGKAIVINESFPLSYIPGQVSPGKELDYFVLTKLRPFEEWGNVKWDVIIGDLAKDSEPSVPVIDEGPANSGDPAINLRPPSPEPVVDYIECPVCTFHNALTATVCEMCGANLK